MQQKIDFGFDGDYYVYALIDPRNNQEFYIGKGKGNRYKSHLNTVFNDAIDNIHKHLRIKDIQNQDLEVITEIIANNLNEETAFKLEEIIIYKLGREVLAEGKLLNYMRGGNRTKNESIFYDDKPNLKIDLSALNKASQKKISSFKKVSKIIYLNEVQHQFKIHTYDKAGILLSIDSIKCFFNKNRNLELFPCLIIEDFPILKLDLIYSKFPLQNFYFSNNINYTINKSCILSEFLFDSGFLRELDKNIESNKNFEMDLRSGNTIRLSASYENETLVLTTYYRNGSKKESKKLITNFDLENEKALAESEYWNDQQYLIKENKFDENGNNVGYKRYDDFGKLKSLEIRENNQSIVETYHANGNLEERRILPNEWSYGFANIEYYYYCGQLKIKYGNNANGVFYEKYYQNSILDEKLIPNIGYVKFNKNGKKISVNPTKHSDFVDRYKILKPIYPITISTEEYLNEKMKAAEEWERYNNKAFKDKA